MALAKLAALVEADQNTRDLKVAARDLRSSIADGSISDRIHVGARPIG